MIPQKKKHKLKFIIDDWISLKRNPFIMIFILLLLPLIYLFVFYTGGIKYVYSHTMYIPIILAAIFYGASFGSLIALFAGILLGPLMPIDTVTNELQDPLNWIYRLIIFIIIGSVIGYASTRLRKDASKIQSLMSVNQETQIPNINTLRYGLAEIENKPYAVFTILINNYQNIIDVLGIDSYHQMLLMIYNDLKYGLSANSIIMQADSNKLWILTPDGHLDEEIALLLSLVDKPKTIDQIPLYIDYTVGAALSRDVLECQDLSIFVDTDISARNAFIENVQVQISQHEKYKKRADYELLSSFSIALSENQTYLAYQPQVDMTTRKVIGLEALLRWKHPKQGLIPPLQFIPLIEETKLIHQLTDWVLKHALRRCRKLIDEGYDIPISINISAKNLYDPSFYQRTIKIINESNVPYHLIQFEITESVLMANPVESKKVLESFVKKGIEIALDDFGSGYSSLAYLTQFPIHVVKIDRMFLQDLLENPSTQEIIRSTVALSKKLGYRVIVEGVENIETVNFLLGCDCHYAQGFYFAKPMDGDHITEWYKNHQ